MPSMTCKCGQVFSTGSFPNQNAYMAIAERDYDDLGEIESVDVLDQLLFSSTRIFQCPACSQLIILWKGSSEAEFYKRENGTGSSGDSIHN